MVLYDSHVWDRIYLLLPKICMPPLDIPRHLHSPFHKSIALLLHAGGVYFDSDVEQYVVTAVAIGHEIPR